MICCYQVMHGTNSLGTVHHLSVFCYGCVWIKVTLVTGACGLKSPFCYGRSGAWLVSRGHGTIAAGALLSAIHDQVLLLHHLVCLLHCLRCYSKPLQCAHCSGSHGSSPAGFSCTSCSPDTTIVPVYSVYLTLCSLHGVLVRVWYLA